MREQRIYARLRGRGIEDKLGLPALLCDRVVVTDHNRAVRIAMRKQPYPKESKVHRESEDGDPQRKHHEAQENPPDSIS